jgi:uncharacterized protein YtpQ (UPF0354 family)
MSDQDTITKEMFASLVLNLLGEAGENNWAVNYQSFSVASNMGAGPQVMNLTRMYQDYITLPSPENFLGLTRQIQLLLKSRANQAQASARLSTLLPCVRTLSSFQQTNFAFKQQPGYEPEKEMIFFPYADVLAMGLVFDNPETMSHLRYVDVEELEMEIEDVIDIAVENLKKISEGPMRIVQPGFYSSPWKDFYDSSRLMLTDLFSGLAVDGDIVALTPAPDALFVTGSNDAIGLELMAALGQTIMKANPRAISALPLVLKDGVWQSFIVPPEHAAFDIINTYRLNILNVLYQSQDSHLAEVAKETGKFVSTYAIENDKNRGYLYSKTSVLDGTASLIPETDVIEFFKSGAFGKKDCVARAPFETVWHVLQQTMLEDSIYRPERWHLSAFPDPAQLKQIGMMPPQQSPLQSLSIPELTILTKLFSLPVPEATRIDSELRNQENEMSIDLVVTCTPVDLSAFYLARLPLGSYMMIGTEQGDFHVAELIGAACTREIWFGPSRRRGETLLRWRKRNKFDTPSVITALSKQTEALYSLERIFGISIIDDCVPQGELKIGEKNARQNFITSHAPEVVARFFRCQMSAMKTVYMPPEQGSPHLIMDPKAGMSVTIKSGKQPDGTLFVISRDLSELNEPQ